MATMRRVSGAAPDGNYLCECQFGTGVSPRDIDEEEFGGRWAQNQATEVEGK